MSEWKDRRLKFIELPMTFQVRASEINILSKQHLRTCEKFAQQLAERKPKTAEEFEKVEMMKDFVIKSVDLNDKTIQLLDYLRGVLSEIAEESLKLSQDAKIFDQLRDQSATIEILTQQRESIVSQIYEQKQAEFRSRAN